LARGVMPPILTERGSRPRLRASPSGRRSGRRGRRPPLPQSIETAAYYVVTEALTNAARYAAASEVRIDGRVVDGRLS
jgi:signal transduction histidine kinase